MKPETRNFLRYWLPPALWTSVIFAASTDAFSAQHTGNFLAVLVALIFGPAHFAWFGTLNFFIRKAAHLTEYAILALLLFRALRMGNAGWRLLWARHAFALCVVVAACDEFHQGFVPSRTSSPVDVAIDSCGALLALMLTRLWSQRRRSAET